MNPQKQNPPIMADFAGVVSGESRHPDHASPYNQLQWRLSAFALALDAVLPDLTYLQHVVELAARGGPMPGDCPQRLYRLALKMFDLRQVLETPLPEVMSGR
ncbi:hypothetical protein INQ40_07800 [Lysobacter sp. H21R4]|uniref:hypothetical protein n=1 Tax=Lysobacter sp. H21R4 TaxID=2781021 RepID=UPI0018896C97|nr:hypothetical protein [Lysobacter sp. H21R4]QOY61872.1 hypothetical protein INQ40_07800 [Lysobacter sp. H21R4]